jgi:hypothetical protein
VLAGDLAGSPRAGGGRDRYDVAVFLQDGDGALEQRHSGAPEFTSPGIVYKDSVAILGDGVSPRASFKL